MNPVEHIRKNVFGCETQARFAELLGTSQVNVSRWETKGRVPGDRMAHIRRLAVESGLNWNDTLFFEAPAQPESVA